VCANARGILLWSVFLWLPCAVAADAAPVIERVEPSAGPPGTLLTIRGRRLHGQTRVVIGETALSLQLSTPNLLTARVESGTASGVLRVLTTGGQVQGPLFTVTREALAPIIERIQPLRGAPGSTVVIYGRRFSQRISQNVVQFGGANAIISAASAEPGAAPEGSATRLEVIVPEGAGQTPLRVRVLGGGEARSAQAFEIVPRLSIASVLPPRAAAGERVEVRGTGFEPAARVYLGALRLRVIEASASRLLVLIPENAESGRLRVESKLAGAAQSDSEFSVLALPVVTRFTPQVGPVGTTIVVDGSGFGQDPKAVQARIGDCALIVRRAAPRELVLEMPPAAHSGKLSIQVGELAPALSALEFAVTQSLLLSKVEPLSGPSGAQVVISGRGFAARPEDNQVTLSGTQVEVLRATPTELTVRVPDAKSAPLRVQVGPSRAATSQAFVVTRPPRIVGVSAESLAVGAPLTVRGSGFGQATALVGVFLDRLALDVLSLRDGAIVLRAPATATTGQLSVRVALQGTAVYPRPIRIVAP
jgi:hypothetical protein